MFHFLDNPKIPKSTNAIESYFGHLKNHLDLHRGLTKQHRMDFIKWYVKQTNCHYCNITKEQSEIYYRIIQPRRTRWRKSNKNLSGESTRGKSMEVDKVINTMGYSQKNCVLATKSRRHAGHCRYNLGIEIEIERQLRPASHPCSVMSADRCESIPKNSSCPSHPF